MLSYGAKCRKLPSGVPGAAAMINLLFVALCRRPKSGFSKLQQKVRLQYLLLLRRQLTKIGSKRVNLLVKQDNLSKTKHFPY